MPLPIPDIMEKAANVIKEARKLFGAHSEHIAEAKPLVDALEKIHENDLLAVLNEIGHVYKGIHNVQIMQLGSRPNAKSKHLEIAIQMNCGLGPQMALVGLPIETAEELIKTMQSDIKSMKPSGFITNV